ncbi:MAG TPA: hypothetical protein DCE41_07020 [Cytophagales bacterium]|nr:hypothetical protein [Cytophagales bacterium]HAA22034.1 hypothetical protein [Cytophagales bacterium]HAP58595.1 hypothetical protein [Cytophagales bacterium]
MCIERLAVLAMVVLISSNCLAENSITLDSSLLLEESVQVYLDQHSKSPLTQPELFELGQLIPSHSIVESDLSKVDEVSTFFSFEQSLAVINRDSASELGKRSLTAGSLDSSEMYFRSMWLFSLLSEHWEKVGHAAKNIGALCHYQGNYPKAIAFYKRASDHFSVAQDSLWLGSTLNDLGLAYMEIGYYDLAVQNLISSVRITEATGDIKMLANILYNIGLVYQEQGDYKKALEHLEEAKNLYSELKFRVDVAGCEVLQAEVWIQLQEYDTARVLLENAKPLILDERGPNYKGQLYHALGKATEGLEDYQKAILYYKMALQFKGQGDDQEWLGQVLNSYAASLYFTAQYHLAEIYYDSAYALGVEAQSLTLLRNASLGLSEVNDSLGNTDQAFFWYKEYKTWEDKIFSIEKTRRIAEVQEKYETEKQEERYERLVKERDLKLKQKTSQLLIAVLGLTLVVFVGISLVYTIRRRRKKDQRVHKEEVNNLLTTQERKTLEAMLEGQEGERKRLAKELHDHFGNLLATARMKINQLEEEGNLPPAVNDLSLIVGQAFQDVRSLSHSLHVGLPDQFGLPSALEGLVKSINSGGTIMGSLSVSIDSHRMNLKQEIEVYRIVQELVSNVLKHANASKLSIGVNTFEDVINVTVEDNGQGMSSQAIQGQRTGMGLKSLTERVTAMQGEMGIDSRPGKGTLISIDLPIQKQTKVPV